MRNIRFNGYLGLRLPREVQLKRVKRVIEGELTPKQRQVLTDYYFRQLTIPEIAREQGINKSSVCRTLHRAEQRLQKYLKY